MMLLVVMGAPLLSPSDLLEASKLPEERILLGALASAVEKRADRPITLRLLDMSTSPPREYLARRDKICAGSNGPIALRTTSSSATPQGASDEITLAPFSLSEDGKHLDGLDAMSEASMLGALFLVALCEPHPIKLLNKTGSMTLDPARRTLLAEDASRPSGGFFYRLDDPEAGSGMEIDFELERVLRLVVRAHSEATPLEVVLLSETVAERGDPPAPTSIWRYALRQGKKVVWIIEAS